MSNTATAAAPAKDRKPRYTEEFKLSAHADESVPVKASRVDLAEYMEHLRGIPKDKQRGFTIPTAAVSVAKSRFSQSAAKLGIGVRFTVVDHGSSSVRPEWQLKEGESRLLISTGERRTVTRKTKEEGKPSGANPGGLAAAVKSAKR